MSILCEPSLSSSPLKLMRNSI